MEKKTIREIEQEYDLEILRIVKTIKKQKAKIVLLQFPDGMKPYAATITEYLEKQLPKTRFLIWLGSCFGACDVPNLPSALKVDMIVQFGHSKWKFKKR